MLCKDCKSKPVVRGIKNIKCFKCSKDSMVNYAFSDICGDCSDTLCICQCCGKDIEKKLDVELKCVKEECRYYLKSDDISICDLVVDGFCTTDECIGYDQLQKEIEDTMHEITYWTTRRDKLIKLENCIGKK